MQEWNGNSTFHHNKANIHGVGAYQMLHQYSHYIPYITTPHICVGN